MNWLIVAISAYFILAVVFLVDKYLLVRAIPDPRIYVFYVGALGILVLILAPFVGFYVPGKTEIILGLLAGAVFIYGLFWFYKTLQIFEPSRVVPAIGGLTPLFTFGLVYLSASDGEVLSFKALMAFVLLVLGSVLVNFKKEKLTNLKGLKFSALTAFLFSLSFVLIKYVYLVQPFWNGFIWRSIGGFLMAFCFFIFFPEIRREIFKKFVPRPLFKSGSGARKERPSKRTAVIFLSNQTVAAGATILQNWAIALVPLVYVPLVNALQGSQYAFLFILAVALSIKFPGALKEEISRETILQKIIAITLICGGLALLAI
ncbi:MAG: hypothetical protein FJZ07_00235 [Candidatus Nealsonbacteria bacterium]|nr:hypothetical protein [Candidatus Nealsonbacteria bacterium]